MRVKEHQSGCMFKRIRKLSWPAAGLLVLYGCSEGGLQKDAQGRVAYEWAKPNSFDGTLTDGRFSHEGGCVIFTLTDGRRFLPIMPEGQLYSVEPMRALFTHEWAVSGFDEKSDAVKSLRDDPVAVECGAAPAFISGIVPPGPPSPAPPFPIPPAPPPEASARGRALE